MNNILNFIYDIHLIFLISNKNLSSFPIWDHIIFPKYLRKNKTYSLDFSNITPLTRPGYVFIHDIYAKLYPQDFVTFKDKLRRFYMCWMYYHATKKGKIIFTVSEFSKKQISEVYKISPKKIEVIPNGWDHFKSVNSDFNIFEKFPSLKNNPFYFTLGSLQKRKNLKWIAEYATNHPEEYFAISGKAISGMVSDDIKNLQTLKNVILLGYVSDEEIKALMRKCKAFVFPSYYEGFGIPPLEALAMGATVICSNAACLPEVFKNSVHYIDPYKECPDLNSLLNSTVEDRNIILESYSWDKSAHEYYNLIKLIIGL